MTIDDRHACMPMSAHFGPFDAVVFDMDGTLLDTEAVFRAVVTEVAAEMGVAFDDALYRAIVGNSPDVTRRTILSAFGQSFAYERFNLRCVDAARTRMDKGLPLKAGAAALLEALALQGVPLAVATSSRRDYAQARLEQTGLLAHLDVLVTLDDVTRPKPHPEPYLTAAARLRVAPAACIAFEDSHAGVRAAHAAGMRTVMVPDLLEPTEEIAALCHAVLESLEHAHEGLLAPRNAQAIG